jgi:hypothetical protein
VLDGARRRAPLTPVKRLVPARFKREITRHLRRLCLVLEMIAEVQAERAAVVDAPAAAGEERRTIRQLARLRAIGARR